MTTTTETSIEQQIRDAIELESSEPAETILRILKENDGKRLDKRVVDKINVALGWEDNDYNNRIVLCKSYGMTQLKWDGSTDGVFSLLICHQTVNVVINADEIKEKNPAYFTAKDERNALRAKVDVGEVTSLATLARIYAIAKRSLETALNLDCFDADRYALQKIVGLDD